MKEHYSKYLYNESKYVKFLLPGDLNSDQMVKPNDELGSWRLQMRIKGLPATEEGGGLGESMLPGFGPALGKPAWSTGEDT